MNKNKIKISSFLATIISGLLSVTVLSCTDSVIEESDNYHPVTRSVIEDASISNPTLLTEWENVDRIVLNTTGNISVYSPWNENYTEGSLSETFRKDIKKEDGWKMLFHTFKEVGFSPRLNYICFYNQFTGFIKIFYYYEGGTQSEGLQWYIKTSEGKQITLLDEPTYLAKPVSEPANNDMLLFSNMNDVPTTGITAGWNGFEFQISRYCTDLISMDLKIGAYEKHITNYNVLGKATLNTVGTITTDKATSTGISNALANLAGPEAKNFIDNLGDSVFGDAVVLGKKISDLITDIPKTGYVSALRSGLDLIFGKTTSTTTYDVYLTTTGTVEMTGTGTSETTADIPVLTFNLYNILNSTTPYNDSNSVLAINSTTTGGHHLGVWTLKENPKVYYNRLVMLQNVDQIGSSTGGGTALITADVPIPQIDHYETEVIINPDVLPYVTNYSYTVKFLICNKLEGQLVNGQDISARFTNINSTLYSDDDREFKELPETNTKTSMELSINADYCNKHSSGAPYWFDWGKVIDGRLVAVVSLNMTCQYEGKETNVYQSRVYDVDYGVDTTLLQPEQVHFPPYSPVVNYGKPYIN